MVGNPSCLVMRDAVMVVLKTQELAGVDLAELHVDLRDEYEPKPVTRVMNPGSVWHYGLVGPTAGRPAASAATIVNSGSCDRGPQMSCTVLPVLTPPWNVNPLRGRATMLNRTPCDRW